MDTTLSAVQPHFERHVDVPKRRICVRPFGQPSDTAHEPKRFVSIEGGDHNDPQSAEYYAALGEFLDRLR